MIVNRVRFFLEKHIARPLVVGVFGLLARALRVRMQLTVLPRSSKPIDWSDASASGSLIGSDSFSLIDSRDVPEIKDAHLYLPQPRNRRQPMVYSPWYGEEDFEEAFKVVSHIPGTSRDCCYLLRALARYAVDLDGHLAECGVWKGKTAYLIAEAASQQIEDKKRHLFDTFEGLPEPDPDPHRDRIPQGTFSDTFLDEVKTLLGPFNFVEFHKGDISETLPSCRDVSFSFVHVDVDLYRSVLECCAFFYPRMVPGGVLVFHAYGLPSTPGAREAVDSFFQEHPETPIYLPTGQCVVIQYPSSK